MKKLLVLLVLVFSFIYLSAHDRLIGLEGIVDTKGNEHYEFSGYEIVVERVIKTPRKEKDIRKIKKRYEVNKSHVEYSSDKIEKTNRIITSQDSIGGAEYPELVVQSIFYIIQNTEETSSLLYFQKIGERDLVIEDEVIGLFLTDELQDYLVPLEIGSVNFAERTLDLGNICKWRSPHNIYCMGGQMSWSIFSSYAEAEQNSNNQILRNQLSKDNIILDDDDIPLFFEGEQVFARRIVYQSLLPGARYPLIVYYISTELRGQYISCVLSHYGYNKNYYELPDLLREVIEFDELPANAMSKYDYPEGNLLDASEQEIVDEKIKEYKYDIYIFALKSGLYLPMGKQKELLGNSAYIDLSLNWAFSKKTFSIFSVFMNIGVVIPSKTKSFEFSDNGLYWDTKTDLLANVNFGLDHSRKLQKQLYWNVYGKIGFGSLTTDIEDGEYEDGRTKYKTAEVFSLGAGTGLRFQRMFAFFEYQFAPYGTNRHMSAGGNSAFMAGVGVAF